VPAFPARHLLPHQPRCEACSVAATRADASIGATAQDAGTVAGSSLAEVRATTPWVGSFIQDCDHARSKLRLQRHAMDSVCVKALRGCFGERLEVRELVLGDRDVRRRESLLLV